MPYLTSHPPRLLLAVALATLAAFAAAGTLRDPVQWLDLLAEGGTAAMVGVWAWVVLSSRPGGRVTLGLGGGLTLLMTGLWADGLDEVFRLDPAWAWLGDLESVLVPAGMAVLTAGLLLWRREQFVLSEHLQHRERLFRDHRAFDRLTQVADAGYLRRQIEAEARRDAQCSVVLLDLGAQSDVERAFGRREAARLLQAATHQILLNLRPNDLACRYAGERLAVLMPGTPPADARERGAHLVRMLAGMRFHARDAGEPMALRPRLACAPVQPDAQALMTALNRDLEDGAPTDPVPLGAAAAMHHAR